MTQRQRRISLIIDLCCGIVLPLVLMAAAIVVQAHRYDIVEGMSPLSPVWPSIPAIFLVYLPPLLICLVSLVYGGKSVR